MRVLDFMKFRVSGASPPSVRLLYSTSLRLVALFAPSAWPDGMKGSLGFRV